ncbi:MAG: T9SS type A sorting domain-containing protein [Bacteroidia bacterium]
MREGVLVVIFLLTFFNCFSQGGYNHQWLIGDQWLQTIAKGRLVFDTLGYQYAQEYRKMAFNDTQGNICDANGNFLMSSNGVWIANATNDTMKNGSGLNPGVSVNTNPNGLYLSKANFFLPVPGDSTKFALFHQTGTSNSSVYPSGELFLSIIDMSLDGGLGGVDSNFKNVIVLVDTLSEGITACKHANGRDWWILALKDGAPAIRRVLFTNTGILDTSIITLGNYISSHGSIGNPVFSNTGDKLAFNIYDNPTTQNSSVVLCDFDRCNGTFSNVIVIPVTNGYYLWGLSFSPDGSKLYVNSTQNIFQINVSSHIVDTVATYDGFYYLFPALSTTFMEQYLAANGKIYLTTGNGTQHLHEINYPDSAGLACDVRQHAVNLGVWNFWSIPNHPNYNLGPVVGSVCDTLGLGIEEHQHDFHFGISPNPVADIPVKIIYLLPENKSGIFELYDITGQLVYKMNLPPWSTLQYVGLPSLSEGVYTAVVRSGYERSAKKLAIIR